MTMTCNRYDVMNILCDIKLKWNGRVTEKGEEMVGGGGVEERESVLSFEIRIHEKKKEKRKKRKKLVLDPNLEKEE